MIFSGELAVQIEKEVYKFNKLLGLRSTTFAGGLSKYQQFRTIKGGKNRCFPTPFGWAESTWNFYYFYQKAVFVSTFRGGRMGKAIYQT